MIMRGIFWPGAKQWRAMREALGLLNAKRSRHAEMHDEELRAVEIGDEIFGAAPEPFNAAVGEALSETFRKRKPQIRPPQVDSGKPLSDHGRFEPAADRFDFGQFRHLWHPSFGYAKCGPIAFPVKRN
jgi:hypothetical protein